MKNHNPSYRLLLVEDEESLAIGLEFNLKEEGYEVDWAVDGKQALEMIESTSFDLIILDIMLPYYDGFEIARHVREKDTQLPILMLTARSGNNDRIKGLKTGADDYLTKPFHLEELLLRISGMLKRKSWYKSMAGIGPEYTFGTNSINFENLKGNAHGKEIELTLHEAMLLKYLIEHKGKIVSRQELLENVWNIFAFARNKEFS